MPSWGFFSFFAEFCSSSKVFLHWIFKCIFYKIKLKKRFFSHCEHDWHEGLLYFLISYWLGFTNTMISRGRCFLSKLNLCKLFILGLIISSSKWRWVTIWLDTVKIVDRKIIISWKWSVLRYELLSFVFFFFFSIRRSVYVLIDV